MGIVIKKKPKFQKKKIIKRIIILLVIYFLSFVVSFAFLYVDNIKHAKVPKADVVVYANDGEKFLAEKKYESAIEYYDKQLAFNPEDYVSMTKMGLAYKNLKQYDKAKFYLFKSYKLAPNYLENYIYATQIYILQKNYDVAESTIDVIPTKRKEDFLAKADLLISLANAINDLEDKIVLYRRAVTYYKKYDAKMYNKILNDLVDLYFELADFYIKKGDIESVKSLYFAIPRYKDTCQLRNEIAIKYKNVYDTGAILNITQAVNKAQSQDEKRLTRKNLIDLKYYFADKGNTENVRIINSLLAILDEETILVDERYTPVSITHDEFKYINNRKEKTILPVLSFKIKNKTDKPVTPIYIKAEIYFHHKKVLETKKVCVVPYDKMLEPGKETEAVTIHFDNTVKKNQLEYYPVGLSLSEDNMNWKLYRIYQSNTIER